MQDEVGVVVCGRWARSLIDCWCARYRGEREGKLGRVVLGAGKAGKKTVRVTAWDVSGTARSLLPMWARRCDVLVVLRGAPLAILEEMLPSTHALVVVAIVDAVARFAPSSAELRREMSSRAMVYCEVSASDFEFKCGELLEVLVARRLGHLRLLLDVKVPRYAAVEDRDRVAKVAYFEVRCAFVPAVLHDNDLGWATPRRYREFEGLRDSLGFPTLGFPPPRRSLDTLLARAGWLQDDRFLDQRRQDLETWLRSLLDAQPLTIAATRALLDFVDPSAQLRDILARARTHNLDALRALFCENDDDENENDDDFCP
ncbi:hypothetical protein CTAYLR_007410 [Chrysophaeum taylorii]|uniref:PX domain-containing protein n=1 Tax=Chrysophaeum taylorii TaxID=2483200 RepID=A0AAD7U4W5_9STRA|nr:hypothetical protein CTAYLR_007410 [Chrysophaeum taylorii]